MIIILMPTLFYAHTLLISGNLFMLDIINFYIVIIASQYAFYYILNTSKASFVSKYLSCLGVFVIFAGYMTFTLMPPRIFIFRDPITNDYGYAAHTEEAHTSTTH